MESAERGEVSRDPGRNQQETRTTVTQTERDGGAGVAASPRGTRITRDSSRHSSFLELVKKFEPLTSRHRKRWHQPFLLGLVFLAFRPTEV